MAKKFDKSDFDIYLNNRLTDLGITEEELSEEMLEIIVDIVDEYLNKTK